MEKEKDLIIPTQNILFAILKDGEIVFDDHKGEHYSPEFCIGLVEGIVKYIKQLPDKDLLMFGLGWGLLSRQISDEMFAKLNRVKEQLL